MARKKALITGITGQDGSYLAELLLRKGYAVYGMVRRTSHVPFARIEHFLKKVDIIDGELTDQASLDTLIQRLRPHEVYNLAAQSFVPASFSQPVSTGNITGLGVARLLEALRRFSPKARFYQASTSEMFGLASQTPQTEKTPFYPRSPYGVAKVYGHYITVNYRESYGLFACSGICFNHESPRRGLEFITRKVTHGAARIKLGLAAKLQVGNLDARRDWGFAGDYVDAMWRMLQQKKPSDYVVATGETHSVRELIELAFGLLGLDWRKHVVVDKKLFRPAEVHDLCGDASKSRKILGWKPTVDFHGLVKMMLESDLKGLRGTA